MDGEVEMAMECHYQSSIGRSMGPCLGTRLTVGDVGGWGQVPQIGRSH